jgi:hypothetical protein
MNLMKCAKKNMQITEICPENGEVGNAKNTKILKGQKLIKKGFFATNHRGIRVKRASQAYRNYFDCRLRHYHPHIPQYAIELSTIDEN